MLVCLLVCSFGLLACSLACLFACLLACSCVRLFVRSFVRLFVCFLFVLFLCVFVFFFLCLFNSSFVCDIVQLASGSRPIELFLGNFEHVRKKKSLPLVELRLPRYVDKAFQKFAHAEPTQPQTISFKFLAQQQTCDTILVDSWTGTCTICVNLDYVEPELTTSKCLSHSETLSRHKDNVRQPPLQLVERRLPRFTGFSEVVFAKNNSHHFNDLLQHLKH